MHSDATTFMSPEEDRLGEALPQTDSEVPGGVEDNNSRRQHEAQEGLDTQSVSGHGRENQDSENFYDSQGDDGKSRSRSIDVEQIRNLIRLVQCRHCDKPFKNAVTLPCGRSICKTCIPQTHVRTSITYPAAQDRQEGFLCPFAECAKEHALSDCGIDVVLNKIIERIEEQIAEAKAAGMQSKLTTLIGIKDPWQAAGISSLQTNDRPPISLDGSRLVATWTLATRGELPVEAEIIYGNSGNAATQQEMLASDAKYLRTFQDTARSEVDCQVCYALFHDPFTTGCGHTFCRPCLNRTLDHANRCPMCRRVLAMNPVVQPELCPSNHCTTRLIETCWPEEKFARQEAVLAEIEARYEDLDLPLFVCTLSFPSMPTFLHVFEPRYRLMLRRALEGNRTFGMVLPKRQRHNGDRHFYELGTLLRIVNAQFYPDGRSLIETVGLTRFRVLRHGELDGYTVAKTERIDDVSLEEEEATEAAEVNASAGNGDVAHTQNGGEEGNHSTEGVHTETNPLFSSTSNGGHTSHATQTPTLTAEDLEGMPTSSLMDLAKEFVRQMTAQGVPWLTDRMLGIYGQCPTDPAIFPWWFASMLPVKDLEKYKLLETSSVRERLKMCCTWIIEWETTRWYVHRCFMQE